MEDKKFGILMFTYNRNDVLKEALTSIQNQTYKNFEVIVLDRGSKPSAESVVQSMNDDRFRYISSSQDIDRVDSGNEIVKNWEYDYFVNPGDDDIYLPDAFRLVKLAFDTNPQTEFIQIGMTTYKNSHEMQDVSKEYISNFGSYDFYDKNKLVVKYDGKKMLKRAFVIANLGDDIEHYPGAHPQPTALFIKKEGIDRNWKNQKGLLLKTFWDAGYLIVAWQNEVVYLNLPLAVFTVDCATRDTQATRRRWTKECSENEHFKYRVASGATCNADTLLKVLHRNKLEKEYDAYLRVDYFIDVFWDIVNDKVKDWQTIKDLFVIVPPLLLYPIIHPIKFIRFAFNNFQGTPKEIMKRFELTFIRPHVLFIRNLFGVKKKQKESTETSDNLRKFDTITDLMEYINNEFSERIIETEKSLNDEASYAK